MNLQSELRACLSPEIFDLATTTASRRLRFAFLLFFRSSSRRLEISIWKSQILEFFVLRFRSSLFIDVVQLLGYEIVHGFFAFQRNL